MDAAGAGNAGGDGEGDGAGDGGGMHGCGIICTRRPLASVVSVGPGDGVGGGAGAGDALWSAAGDASVRTAGAHGTAAA